MSIIAIRGAITADNNTTEDIASASLELFEKIISANNIDMQNIINITFSITKDLNAVYPAKIIREKFDLSYTPLFCLQEADIHNSLEKCIRVMILVNADILKQDVKHIYLKNAKNLRPDLNL